MDSLICVSGVETLDLWYIPRTTWWAVAISITMLITYVCVVMSLVILHYSRKRSKKHTLILERRWRRGTLPLLLVGLLILYFVFNSSVRLHRDYERMLTYYTQQCTLPQAEKTLLIIDNPKT